MTAFYFTQPMTFCFMLIFPLNYTYYVSWLNEINIIRNFFLLNPLYFHHQTFFSSLRLYCFFSSILYILRICFYLLSFFLSLFFFSFSFSFFDAYCASSLEGEDTMVFSHDMSFPYIYTGFTMMCALLSLCCNKPHSSQPCSVNILVSLYLSLYNYYEYYVSLCHPKH